MVRVLKFGTGLVDGQRWRALRQAWFSGEPDTRTREVLRLEAEVGRAFDAVSQEQKPTKAQLAEWEAANPGQPVPQFWGVKKGEMILSQSAYELLAAAVSPEKTKTGRLEAVFHEELLSWLEQAEERAEKVSKK